MTDGLDDAIDELDESIDEIRAKTAEQNANRHDWFDTTIDLIDAMIESTEGAEPPEFTEGMEFARFQVRFVQLTHSDAVSCECSFPFPDMLDDGAWVCANCDTTLLTDDMSDEAREQLRGDDE